MEQLSKSAIDSLPRDSFCPQPYLKQPLSGAESLEKYSDWVVMFHYKTQPCLLSDCQQWSSCWGYHSPGDRRRVPAFIGGKFTYEGIKCTLQQAPQCNFAYNVYEVAFHPLNYHTTLCQGLKVAGSCYLYGKYCRNAHKTEEIRSPADLYSQSQVISTATLAELMQLSELRADLEARLLALVVLVERRRSELDCAVCSRERQYLYSLCGHAVCGKCSQSEGKGCVVCGVQGELILLR